MMQNQSNQQNEAQKARELTKLERLIMERVILRDKVRINERLLAKLPRKTAEQQHTRQVFHDRLIGQKFTLSKMDSDIYIMNMTEALVRSNMILSQMAQPAPHNEGEEPAVEGELSIEEIQQQQSAEGLSNEPGGES